MAKARNSREHVRWIEGFTIVQNGETKVFELPRNSNTCSARFGMVLSL
jgi:hypothetical protein